MLDAMKTLHVMNGVQPLVFEAVGNTVHLKSSLLGREDLQHICTTRPIMGRNGEAIPARIIAAQIAGFLNMVAELGKESFEEQIEGFLNRLEKEPPSRDPVDQKVQQALLSLLRASKKK